MAGQITAATLDSGAASTAPVFSANGSQIGTLCRAWVSFYGLATATVNASFNVSSVTFRRTGYYTVNFTTPMPDNKYATVGAQQHSIGGGEGPTNYFFEVTSGAAQVTNYVYVNTFSGGTPSDSYGVYVACFR